MDKRSSRVATAWQTIANWLRENRKPAFRSLRKPATKRDLAASERALKCKLSTELWQLYELHDGANDKGSNFQFPPPKASRFEFADYCFLPLTEVVKSWNDCQDCLECGDFDRSKAKPARGVSRTWWNPRWIPFAGNYCGEHFCVDFAPATGGTRGQVIQFCHDDPTRRRLAPSLLAWLEMIAKGMERGQIICDPQEGVGWRRSK